MGDKVLILGEAEDTINSSFSISQIDIKKIIITQNFLISNISSQIKTFLEDIFLESKLMKKNDFVFSDIEFSNEFESSLNEKLNFILKNFVDINLKGYSFLNIANNSKYNITIKNGVFSITIHLVDKSNFIISLKKAIIKYLNKLVDFSRSIKDTSFQVEIWEYFDVSKKVILKKSQDKIIISSILGNSNVLNLDNEVGSEIYFSNEKSNFNFFKNRQSYINRKEENSMISTKISHSDKILTNSNLVDINRKTKDLDDVFIEILISQKEEVKIFDVDFVQKFESFSSEFGFVISKSSNSFNKVSIVSLREGLEDEFVNPKYLLIRNYSEVCEILNNIDLVKKNNIDGLIFTINFYSRLIENICEELDIDCFFYNQNLVKTNEIEFDLDNFNFKSQNISTNPFENIIEENNDKTPKDAWMEKLKNIDLESSPTTKEDQAQIESVAQSLVSSPNSSAKNLYTSNSQNGMDYESFTHSNKKKSAFSFLMDNINFDEKGEVVKNNSSQTEPLIEEAQTSSKAEIEASNTDFSDLFEPQINPLQNQDKLEDSDNKIDKYLQTLSTKLFSPTRLDGINGVFLNENSFAQIQTDNNFNFLVFSQDRTPNLNTSNSQNIYPFLSNENIVENDNIMLNSIEDFFKIRGDISLSIFINLIRFEDTLKKGIIESSILKFKKVNLILLKKDLEIVEEFISKVDKIYIQDLDENSSNDVRNKILGFEKSYLIKNIEKFS